MSTSAETMAYIEDQLSGLPIRSGKMFGEYAVYLDEKVVGFVCDDTLFIKYSDADPAVLEGTHPGKPYPGAKDYAEVPGDLLENREWLQAAVSATAAALPVPPPKKPKAARRKPAASGGGGGV